MAGPQSKIVGDVFVVLLGLGTIIALGVAILAKNVDVSSDSKPTADNRVATISESLAPPAESVSPDTEVAIFGEVGSLRLIPLATVPTRPGQRKSNCQAENTTALSDEGASARAAGWDVVLDERFGPYRVVAVHSGSRDVDGLGCVPLGASLLVFRQNQLMAVAYDTRKKPQLSSLTKADRYSDSLIRLSAIDGPLAEIVLDNTSIKLRSLPPFDAICGGRSRLPRIERAPYLEARQKLTDEGWIATDSDRKFGVAPELNSASDSVWFARFRKDGGDIVTLLTGSDVDDFNHNGQIDSFEDPLVQRFAVHCEGDSPERPVSMS